MPIVASAGLGHVTVVVLVLFWYFCQHFDDCREMLVLGSLFVGMYVTHSESGIKYLIEVCFGHLKSHKPHETKLKFLEDSLISENERRRRF